MPASSPSILHWFRRDLRVTDNTALLAASDSGQPVIPLYILSDWKKSHAWTGAGRQQFLCECLEALSQRLTKLGGRLIIRQGEALAIFEEVILSGAVSAIHFNVDPDPFGSCLLYTSPSPRDQRGSRMPSSA